MKNILTPFLLLSLVLPLSLAVCARDPYPVNPNIDVLHYRFEIELNDTTNIIVATANITVFFKKPQSQLVLDLVGKDREGSGMTVQDVSFEGKPLSFVHKNNRLTLTLLPSQKANEQHTYRVRYAGIPSDGLIIANNKFGERTFFGDNWPDRARHWLAAVDHPSDKASCEFVVTAPAHYQVVGNGIKVEQSNLDGQRILTHWSEKKRLPTKVMVIGVARFAVATVSYRNPTAITTWVYPQNKHEGFSDFSIAPQVVDYFQHHVAPYPYQKLANVQSKTRYGGMENASAIFYFENAVTGKNEQENLIAHEVAHQWFGNAVSEMDWHHVWLSEGFATYFTNLYLAHTYGFDKLKSRMNNQRLQVTDYYKKSPNPIIDTTVVDINKMLNVNSYQKGAWVLHMLRHRLGDATFWKGIREYYRIYENGNALTQDFRRVMENISGNDLKPFFDQWLRRSGHPILSVKWKYNPQSKSINIAIEQTQRLPFQIPLDLEVRDTEGGTTLHTLNLDNRIGKFNLSVKKKPLTLTLDPNVKLLFEGKINN